MKLQEKIFYCRRKAGLSQEALAEKIGVSRQAVSKWETGEALPEVGKLLLLARVFDVTTDWLLSEEATVRELADEGMPEKKEHPEFQAMQQASRLDEVPGVIGRLVKKYGWLLGVREAIGGVLMLLMGILMKAVTGSMNNIVNSSFGSPFGAMGGGITWTNEFGDVIDAPVSDAQMQAILGSDFGYSSAGGPAVSMTGPMDLVSGFVIFLGAAMLVMGIVVAVWLKKKGSMPENQQMK